MALRRVVVDLSDPGSLSRLPVGMRKSIREALAGAFVGRALGCVEGDGGEVEAVDAEEAEEVAGDTDG